MEQVGTIGSDTAKHSFRCIAGRLWAQYRSAEGCDMAV